MSLKYFIIQLILIFSLIRLSIAADPWIKATIDLTINTNFERALMVVQEQINLNPGNYRAWFYLAATYNSKMTHFENEDGVEQFDDAIDKTIDLINDQFENDKVLIDSIRAQLLFYIGSAYGYRAYLRGRQGQYVAAISNGLKSVSYLNESLEKDSTLYSAYLGIGVYKYWRYSRLDFISWLPFIPDDRDEGIVMINMAIANDSLSKYIAMHQLIYILLDYGKFDEALVFAEIVVEKYSRSQFMWWANAHAYFKKGSYREAEKSYEKLYQLILQDKNRNITHLLKCQYKLALVARYLKNYQICKQHCENLLQFSENEDLTNAAWDILSDTENLWEDCQEQLKDSP